MRAYEAEWGQFVEAATEGKLVPATVQDGVTALKIVEAAGESLRSGKMAKM